MIGSRSQLGKGFSGLQQYLLHGRNAAAPDRSVWASRRNLPNEDLEHSAGIMRSTANRSERVEKPVYHLSVSMAPGERLDREELERVADRLLSDLGLDEHQVLIAEHADGAQQHIHLMINRVHPETGKAWSAWRDYPRIEQSLRSQERELGLRIVPGRHAPVPEHERYVGTRLGVGGFAERARELAGESFQRASSWQELHASLSQEGLSLQPSRSGRGLVVTDGRRFAAASKVAREASRPRLESRLGPFERASPDLRRIQEISRTLAQRRRLERMRSRFRGSRMELRRVRENHDLAVRNVARASARLDAALGRVFRDPAAARQMIDRALRSRGHRSTAKSLSDRPRDYGQLLGRVGSRERKAARAVLKAELPMAVEDLAAARAHQRSARRGLEPFRRNPDHSLLRAAGRAGKVLARGLQRLEELDRRYPANNVLRAQAAAIVHRVGWEAVARLVPGPAYQALRIAVSLAKAPGQAMDLTLGR